MTVRRHASATRSRTAMSRVSCQTVLVSWCTQAIHANNLSIFSPEPLKHLKIDLFSAFSRFQRVLETFE